MIRWLALALALTACAAEGDLRADEAGETLFLPAAHVSAGLYTRLCRPAAPGPARLVVINHGSPGDASVRPAMRPGTCQSEAVRWFTARGFLVALPMRRGYGQTGGAWAEGFGACSAAEYGQAGQETARDILAALQALRARGDVAATPALVVGQSAGGWGALALAAQNPREVGAIVNMAGGRGGRRGNMPNNVCRPEGLVQAAGGFGGAARIPALWIYAANDSFFDHELARGMASAWRLGGAPITLRLLPAFGRDGHGLFFGAGGSAVWGPEMEAFLR